MWLGSDAFFASGSPRAKRGENKRTRYPLECPGSEVTLALWLWVRITKVRGLGECLEDWLSWVPLPQGVQTFLSAEALDASSARCSPGFHGPQVGGSMKTGCRHPGKIQGEPSRENTMIYFLDRVLPCQDELCSRLLEIHRRTTNILHLRSLHRPNFFNDFFFLKIHELAPTGHCQEPSERLSKLLVTSETGEFPSASVPTSPLSVHCLEAGATRAQAALQRRHQPPAWGHASAFPPLALCHRAVCNGTAGSFSNPTKGRPGAHADRLVSVVRHCGV